MQIFVQGIAPFHFQQLPEFGLRRVAFCEVFAVFFAKRLNKGVAVLLTNPAILVAVAVV